jgi:acrylyl-CoA reductase (NADPH)
MFQAVVLNRIGSETEARIDHLGEEQLPDGEVTVRISHSCLNYKDALAITGKGAVVRSFPMIPGIDLSGSVVSTTDARFSVGDQVILNGFGVGETHWGGLASKARVKADWLIQLPAAMTSRQAMQLGTAGYTAMLCVMALEQAGVTPTKGDILVTGAGGGVGGVAIQLLSTLG